MKTIGTILAVTLGLGLIAAGCGDDDSGDGALTAAGLPDVCLAGPAGG